MRSPYCCHCGIVDDLHSNLYCRLMQSDRAELKRLRAEKRWIPVKERLPDLDERVAVTIAGTRYRSVAWRYLDDGSWSFYCTLGEPTHWMPLPPLPGEEVQR